MNTTARLRRGPRAEILLPVLARHPALSVSDLWVLAGYESVEALAGPRIEMSWGRLDAGADQAPEICPPAERLPDWADGASRVMSDYHFRETATEYDRKNWYKVVAMYCEVTSYQISPYLDVHPLVEAEGRVRGVVQARPVRAVHWVEVGRGFAGCEEHGEPVEAGAR